MNSKEQNVKNTGFKGLIYQNECYVKENPINNRNTYENS